MSKYYAVRKGRVPGIYTTWDDCLKQINGYSSAEYKSFKTAQEAAEFLGQAEKSEIKIDKDTLIAYVDGSYNISTKEYGSGVVLLYKDKEVHLTENGNDDELATMRNVAGEIKASEMAMKYAVENGYKKLVIYYDYEGIEKWCTGAWKTNKEGTKTYKKKYDEYSKQADIGFVKVKGHSGDKYNDIADVLAKKAAKVE